LPVTLNVLSSANPAALVVWWGVNCVTMPFETQAALPPRHWCC
jgi:hypothetical protein